VASSFKASLKDKDPKNIRVDDVYAYLSRVEKQSKPNTLRNYAMSLRSFLRFLGRADLADRIKPIRPPVTIRVILTSDEVQRMIEAASNLRDRLIVQILAKTGLRVGELCSLELSDLNLAKRQIMVRSKGTSGPKGRRERVVFIDSETAELIKTYVGSRTEGSLVNLSPSTIRLLVKKLARQANIKNARKITPHTIRHFFACYFLQNGGDVRSLQKILGHSELATTAIYLQFSEEAVARAYDSVFEKREENV
jgi:site-specific recombinase XerD